MASYGPGAYSPNVEAAVQGSARLSGWKRIHNYLISTNGWKSA